MILMLKQSFLVYFSLIFTLLPHLMSNIITIIYISKWSKTSINISKYISKYDSIVVMISMLSGFYMY